MVIYFAEELTALLQYIKTLHLDCDFLIKYFDVRKEAQAGNINTIILLLIKLIILIVLIILSY